MNPTVIQISLEAWDRLAETEDRPFDRIVYIAGADPSECWAWSPDGRGATYFSSLADLKRAVGFPE